MARQTFGRGKMNGSNPLESTMRNCQGKCKLDQETLLCLGCQRSIQNIKQAYKDFLTNRPKSDINKAQTTE